MRTKPGIERITKQELQACKRGLEYCTIRHLNCCYQCQKAGDDIHAKCDLWWDMAKSLHRINRKLRQYTVLEQQPQLDLDFGD